ncbi:hypothetical protein PRIPAC_92142, partial [Pristionchus pacificus]|uniref:Uncharacterized protein n=1 Tax=Pristionchus pacificus TaxID=54126 RepID=A0A2A6BAG6_PRIPA
MGQSSSSPSSPLLTPSTSIVDSYSLTSRSTITMTRVLIVLFLFHWTSEFQVDGKMLKDEVDTSDDIYAFLEKKIKVNPFEKNAT